MSQYKPYPAYKDSGVEWLGRVPEHWEVYPLKYLVSSIESGTSVNATDTPARQGEFGVLKTSCVYSGKFNPAENKAILPEEYGRASCPLVVGSLVVSRMNTPDLVGAAGLVWQAPDGIFLPDRLWQVSFSGMIPTFSYYWMQSSSYRTQVKMVCTGTSSSMQNLSQDQFKDFVVGVPAEDEQQLIAAHLDRETARIDALIEKKTCFIELLREKRQALITHAVTKGLDPNVKMKDSGVEWLGEVPEHWEISPLKRLVSSIGQGWSPECEARVPEDGEWGVLKVGCVNGGIFRPEESKALPSEMGPRPELGLKSGDVLVSRANTRELVGSCAVVPRDYPRLLLCDKLYRIGCSERVTPEFLAALVAVYGRRAVEIEATGASSSMVNIAQSVILDLVVAFPCVSEQIEIISRVSSAMARLEMLRVKTEHSITLLKERRSALITAAVTGQIDLRKAV